MGTLLAGVPGVPAGKIVILGSGVVGANAARIAVGLGARVFALDRSVDALRRIECEFGARVVTVYSSRDAIEQHVLSADLVIGAVLVPGAAAPRLVSRALLARMKRGAALVDGLPDARAYQDRPWYGWILIPHELSHQWFGDYVTTENWANTWLNEGFAEFMPGQYWRENLGRHAADDYYSDE